jgi:DNA polymerase-4
MTKLETVNALEQIVTTRKMENTRKIIHIDMDAFYASVEQRDRPELKGKPVVVGGDPNKRGVVAACSYEARKFGIHSAMASSRAFKLCPHAIFLRPNFDVYRSVSADIRKIFYEYTDIVEPLSLDEAFLDVTENKKKLTSATLIAKAILKQINQDTGGLTASAGVSFNKFLAKAASDFNKPNGIKVVTPDDAAEFTDNLPVRKFFGVGKVTEEKMHHLGIMTGADLKKIDKEKLINLFGKSGHYFYNMANGIDNRPVETKWIRKSIGKETTLIEDINDINEMIDILSMLAAKIENLLKRDNRQGMTVTLKVKYSDFQRITRSVTVKEPISDADIIMKYVQPLLENTEAGMKQVRLLGISISNFTDEAGRLKNFFQLHLPFHRCFHHNEN